MAIIDRTTILRGPGTATWAGITLFDAEGIEATLETSTKEITSSISGKLDTIKTDQTAKVTLTPCGQLTDAILAALYPHQIPVIGTSLCGAADRPLTIHSMAGTKLTFHNGIITKCPEIILSPVATAFGSAEFSALLAKGKTADQPTAFYTVEEKVDYTAGAPDPTGITGAYYTAKYGTLDIPDTVDGWKVTVELAVEPVVTDALGTIDYTLSGVTVRATCTPLGLSEGDLLKLSGIAKPRGASLAGASDLVITGAGGLAVTLRHAALVQSPLKWGNTANRIGEIAFEAHRDFTGDTPGELYRVVRAQ